MPRWAIRSTPRLCLITIQPNTAFRYANAVGAIVILAFLVVWRYTQPIVRSPSLSYSSNRVHVLKRRRKRNRTSNEERTAYQRSVQLSHMGSAYSPSGQVRAADTDADGRRLGTPGDPEWDGTEGLPMYTKTGSPPSYIESRLSSAGSTVVGYPFGQPPVSTPACASGNDTCSQTGGEIGEQLDTLALEDIRPPPPAYHPP